MSINRKISALTAATSLTGGELSGIQGGDNKRFPVTLFATAAQGALAATATQPGDLATVATTGAYSDLTGTPTLGTAAAADTGDFATAAQGTLADSALQSSDIGTSVQAHAAVLDATTASFTTALETKLSGIAAGAEVNTVDSVNALTGAVVLDPDDLDDTATTNKFTTAADISKLAGIEALADVTDATNVAAAGAVMDSDIGVTVQAYDANLTNVREVLTANRTYYVRTDGSDSNDGLTDSSGGAFLTIQKALNTVLALDISTYDVTIQVQSGTYTTAFSVPSLWVGSGTVTLQGDTTTPSNVILNVTGVIGTFRGNARLGISGFKAVSTSHNFNHASVCDITYSNMEWGGGNAAVRATYGAKVTISGANHTISAGYNTFYNGIYCQFNSFGATITLTGTPAFGVAFCYLTDLSYCLVSSVTFTGSATGTRYSVSTNSVCNTSGGGASYLPGDSAGATATGGQYV